MKQSSLGSRTDRSTAHLRWTKSADGWGGDEDVTLAQIDTFSSRVEPVEGVGERDRWDVWIFDSTADLQVGDILIIEEIPLALTIRKSAPYTKLKGDFHHFELLVEEHVESAATLLALLP